jgi:Tfp pilus assembly protein PilO
MELPFEGRYKAIKDFLAEIEKSPSVLCVERLKIARVKDGSLELSITLASYLR